MQITLKIYIVGGRELYNLHLNGLALLTRLLTMVSALIIRKQQSHTFTRVYIFIRVYITYYIDYI